MAKKHVATYRVPVDLEIILDHTPNNDTDASDAESALYEWLESHVASDEDIRAGVGYRIYVGRAKKVTTRSGAGHPEREIGWRE
jgi:hypothetical protein